MKTTPMDAPARHSSETVPDRIENAPESAHSVPMQPNANAGASRIGAAGPVRRAMRGRATRSDSPDPDRRRPLPQRRSGRQAASPQRPRHVLLGFVRVHKAGAPRACLTLQGMENKTLCRKVQLLRRTCWTKRAHAGITEAAAGTRYARVVQSVRRLLRTVDLPMAYSDK